MHSRRLGVSTFVGVAALALVLSGCGGGGGGNVRSPTGGNMLPPVQALNRIIQSADSLLVSDVVPPSGSRIQADCAGTTCTMSGEAPDVSLSDVTTGLKLALTLGMEATETHRGVSLNTLSDYGGWLQYNYFAAGRGTAGTTRYPLSISFGDATGSNPVRGSATWSGVMVGVDVSATRYRNRIRGDADLTIADFADPKLDVAFTNIIDIDDSSRRRADMTWDDVPVTSGGFETGSHGNSIQGKSYGPNHEEAGGVFERDQVIGAFGAKRP